VKRALGSLLVGAGLLAGFGCGSAPDTDRLATVSRQGARNPLVGTWRRVNSCRRFVRALEDAGIKDQLHEWLVGGGYFDDSSQIDDVHPCRGAKEVEHSHFFTESGRFGSHDETGAQVDDGDYEIVDKTTVTFPSHVREFGGEITVHYRVEGKTLNFAVVVPAACTGDCRLATAWAISAFYPGPFERVE
jgi:hypothetical protein